MVRGIAPIVDFVYPPRCPACGRATGAQTGLCTTCWSELAVPGHPLCTLCSIPLFSDDAYEEAICSQCVEAPPLHDGIFAATIYDDVSRKLILAFKHGRKIALARLLARLVVARLPKDDVARIVIPVPLHRWRLWQRGYNQAALLAQEISLAGHGSCMVDGLIRTRSTPPLGNLPGTQRRDLLAGNIRVKPARRSRIENADVLLVDDVVTTGATNGECVRVLKEAGAKSVIVGCVARAAFLPRKKQ
ncbi:ComF family protein [Altererythrobacter aurantiacus]|uniref:ComF family protein n=1 Tax=Parapontixanthobacter aurantiacus TaxID=1463599 RepID=A0A844ZHS0_9SPHN|nr:ComF family protein [Parapontixanthobacter aurantiacus]